MFLGLSTYFHIFSQKNISHLNTSDFENWKNYLVLCQKILNRKRQAQHRAAKETAEGKKITLIKKTKTYDETMMSQLERSYSVIGNNSGIRKITFCILIIIIHTFLLYMQGKWGYKKKAITLLRICWNLNIIFN